MQALGYLYKKIAPAPLELTASGIKEIYSLSNCISKNFADYIQYWKHNGFWLFDSPEIMEKLAVANSQIMNGQHLFYYEGFEKQFVSQSGWESYAPEPSLITQIQPPKNKILEGFDVVTFSTGNSPECSPLSCNLLAQKFAVNGFCLFESFDAAFGAVEQSHNDFGEPGPYRIVAVYSVAVQTN